MEKNQKIILNNGGYSTMAKCEWCDKEVQRLVRVKLARTEYKICNTCLELFKDKKCIDCKCDVKIQNQDKGRCIQCAQEYNTKKEKERQNEINRYPFKSENDISDAEFEAWLCSKPTKLK